MSAAVVLALASVYAGDTQAQVDAPPNVTAANASGLCQGSLPASADNLRSGPLAIANVGASDVFVSCSLPTGFQFQLNQFASVVVTNRSAADVDVTCTFVDGSAVEELSPSYYPQTVNVASGTVGQMFWAASDFDLVNFTGFANFSCSLPAGVELNLVSALYSNDTP